MDYETIHGLPPKDVLIFYHCLGVMALLGIIGNVINVVVWTRPNMKCSSAIMLAALAVSDIIIVLCMFPHAYFTVVSAYELFFYRYEGRTAIVNYISRYVIACMDVWLYPLHSIAQTASIYLTLAITVERFIAVCYPFEYQDVCSYARACKVTAVIIIFSILVNLMKFWDMELRPSIESDGTVFAYYAMPSNISFHPMMVIYRDWFRLIFMIFIPLVALIGCNTTICWKLKMAGRERRGLTDFQKKELRLSLLLVYIVFEFIVCFTITAFVTIANIFNIYLFFNPDPLKLVSDASEVFNSSVNFVTYVTFGKPFRKTFVKTFCCSKGQQSAPEREIDGEVQQNKYELEYSQ